jgi:hypothetical protein
MIWYSGIKKKKKSEEYDIWLFKTNECSDTKKKFSSATSSIFNLGDYHGKIALLLSTRPSYNIFDQTCIQGDQTCWHETQTKSFEIIYRCSMFDIMLLVSGKNTNKIKNKSLLNLSSLYHSLWIHSIQSKSL